MENFKGKGLVDYSESTECSDDDDQRGCKIAMQGSSGDDGDNNDDRGNCSQSTEGGEDNEVIESNVEGNYRNLRYEDVMGREFVTLDDAEAFYVSYARQVGFGVRRYSFKKTITGVPRLRTWVCRKEGKRNEEWFNLPGRKRKPRVDFREECPAKFQVNYNRKTNVWVVNSFVMEHSHELMNADHVQFLTSHRKVDAASKAEINALRSAGVDTRHIIDLMAMQSGGFDRMGFIARDVYNHIQAEKSLEPPNGDIQGVMTYFYAKRENDPGFYFNNSVDGDTHMGNLFWADSVSRYDYACFGDVVAFDSAFKRNRYNRPLVLMIGINHHRQTIIFGCGILACETQANYCWLLRQFIECMGGRKPPSVVTDGDLSMSSAISSVLPDATHRLCSFHLKKNANRHVKDPKFADDFTRLMFRRINIEQFDNEWDQLVVAHNLTDNPWVTKLWEARAMWAEAYLMERFFGGTRTTSRCESMHSVLKGFKHKKLTFTEFVRRYDLVLSKIRHKEMHLDHLSQYGKPICKHPCKEFEIPAANIYTLESFTIFQEQLNEVVAYRDFAPPVRDGDEVNFFVGRYNTNARCRVVSLSESENRLSCSCQLMQSTGFPCPHLLYVMKRELFSSIPPMLILRRWTKEAKSTVPTSHANYATMSHQFLRDIRFGDLCNSFRRLCSVACETEDSYVKVRENISILSKCVDDMLGRGKSMTTPNEWDNVMDPKLPKRREREESKKATTRRCSICKGIGHTKPRCPMNAQVVASRTIFEGSCSAPEENFSAEDDFPICVSAKTKFVFQLLLDYYILNFNGSI